VGFLKLSLPKIKKLVTNQIPDHANQPHAVLPTRDVYTGSGSTDPSIFFITDPEENAKKTKITFSLLFTGSGASLNRSGKNSSRIRIPDPGGKKRSDP
jgi:hypothetical protein